MVIREGRMGEGTVRESGMDMDTLLYLTWRSNKDLLDSTGNSAQYSVISLWFPGGRMGEGIARESGHGHAPCCIKHGEPARTCWTAQGTLLSVMWQPGWEGSLGETGYVCMCGWVPLLPAWDYHSIGNQPWKTVKVIVAQSCPTLCSSVDCSPPGSSVPGILQARVLEWAAMPSSRGSSWPRGLLLCRQILYCLSHHIPTPNKKFFF